MTLVVGAVVVDSLERPSRVLAARRLGKHAGLWEFPGGKVESGETPEAALVREIREELGADIDVVAEVTADAPIMIDKDLEMRLFLALYRGASPRAGASHDEVSWLQADELEALSWLDSDREALPLVRQALGWSVL